MSLPLDPPYPDSPPTAPPTTPPTAPPPPSGQGPSTASAVARRSRRAPRPSAGGRTVLGVVLVFLAGVSATFGLTSFWAAHEMLDADTWASTSRAIVSDPTVQADVARSIAEQVVETVGVENLVQNSLPAPFNRFSGVFTEQATNLLTTAAEKVVATDAFAQIWDSAVRSVHDEFVHAVDGSSTITTIGSEGLYLQVGPALEQVKAQLVSMGVPLLDRIDLSSIDVRVLLVDAPGLDTIRTWVHALRIGAIVFPAIAVVCLLIGMFVARRRAYALLAGGVGLLLGVVVVRLIESARRATAIDEISGGLLGRSSAKVIVDQITKGLDDGLVILAIVGVVVAAVGAVFAFRSRTGPSPLDEVAT